MPVVTPIVAKPADLPVIAPIIAKPADLPVITAVVAKPADLPVITAVVGSEESRRGISKPIDLPVVDSIVAPTPLCDALCPAISHQVGNEPRVDVVRTLVKHRLATFAALLDA